MADKRPIIIIKKKINHGGHHGGAWKVAYADFVTAMMALFIVLWLTSSGEKVKKSIAGYFNDPTGSTKEIGTDKSGDGDSVPLDKKDISELKDRLERQIAQQPNLKKLENQVDIIITPEGMRIELMESKNGTFFLSGDAGLNEIGRELMTLLAKELGTVPNRVSIEGHTDARAYAAGTKYDNWELSTDRANDARRLMQAQGLHTGQLAQVRGFADQNLRVPGDPMDPSNRRISVIVHYLGFTMTSPGSKSRDKVIDAIKDGKVIKGAETSSRPAAAIPAAAIPVAATGALAKPATTMRVLQVLPSLGKTTVWLHSTEAWSQKMSSSLLHRKPAFPEEAPATEPATSPILAKPAS